MGYDSTKAATGLRPPRRRRPRHTAAGNPCRPSSTVGRLTPWAAAAALTWTLAWPASLWAQPEAAVATAPPESTTEPVVTAAPKAQAPNAGPVLGTWWAGDFAFAPSAQYLLRFRHQEGQDFSRGHESNTLRHRARIGLDASYKQLVGVFVQLQDVRLLGEARDTLSDYSADGIDAHQAYARLSPVPELELRVGRQEIMLENQRLIGNVGFVEQARSFDAVRVRMQSEPVVLESFYAKVADDSSTATDGEGNRVFADDIDLLAGALRIEALPELTPSVVLVLDSNSIRERRLATMGGILASHVAPIGLNLSAEGYYQRGVEQADVVYSSFLVAARAKLVLDVPTKPWLEAFGEFLSGDDDPSDGTKTTFDTLYATNHKFYGEADFFLNIPKHTSERGLRDVGGSIGLGPIEGFGATVSYHWFSAMAARPDGLGNFGHELDAKLTYKPWKPLALDLCYALFVPGDIARAPVADPRVEHFVYSTVDTTF